MRIIMTMLVYNICDDFKDFESITFLVTTPTPHEFETSVMKSV